MSKPAGNSPKKNYFFDISALLEYIGQFERYSGIQRVVATLIVRFAALPDVGPVYLSFVDPARRVNLCVPFAALGPEAFETPARLRKAFFPRPAPDKIIGPLRRYRERKFKYRFHKYKLDLMYALRLDQPFRRFGVNRAAWPRLRDCAPRAEASTALTPAPLASVARPGDKLILLDSSWQPRHTEAFAMARSLGVDIYPFVHDLIPLVAAATIENGEVARIFYDWLNRSAAYATRFLANSQATADDMAAFLAAHGYRQSTAPVPLAQAGLEPPSAAPDARAALAPGPQQDAEREIMEPDVIEPNVMEPQDIGPKDIGPIGARLYPIAAEAINLRAEVRAMAVSPFALCVGTIEARKNIWRLLAAWKLLLDRGHYDLPRLAIAGRKGWLSDDVEQFLAGAGHIYGYVRLIDTPSDAELAFLYRHCRFGVMVSLYEGWGLPVGEALAYGKTSVVARAGALPEVGGDLVEYCDPLSVKDIAATVWRLAGDDARLHELEARIAATRLRSWDDVARDLLSAVQDQA